MKSGLLRAEDHKEVNIKGIHIYDNGFAEIIFSDGYTMLLDRRQVFPNMGFLHKDFQKDFGIRTGGMDGHSLEI